MKKIFCLSYILFCFLVRIFAQRAESHDSCKIYEGYIVRIFEKCSRYERCRSDFLFYEQPPNLRKPKDDVYSSDFIENHKFYLFSEGGYENFNMERQFFSEKYRPFYSQTSLDSVISERFRVYLHKVIVCGTLTTNSNDYFNFGSSHFYSAFKPSDSIGVLNAKIVINK